MSGPENVTPPPPTPPPAAPTPPPAQTPPPPGSSTASQATEMVGSAVSAVRERLVAGEQLVLTAAATIVVVVFLVFQFLLDYFIATDMAVVVAALAVLAIWVHRWGHYDFGKAYRIVIGALGVSLALFAVINLLTWARAGGGSQDFLQLIGRLIYWVAGIAAGYGAWLVFRVRD
jgi:hypothetical protein